MAASASKTLLNKVYRRSQSALESSVDAKPNEVAKLLQTYLSEAQKALLSTSDKKAKAATLKKLLKEKMSVSEENCFEILRAFKKFIDTTKIIGYFERELQKEHGAGRRFSDPSISYERNQSDEVARPRPGSASSKGGQFQYGQKRIPFKIQTTSSRSPTKQLTALPLETIPGSPFNRRISDEGPAESELDSTFYKQPVETSTPEHTIVQKSSTHPAKKEVVAPRSKSSHPPSRRLPVGRTPIKDDDDEIGVITELDKLLEKIIEEKHGNVDEYKAQFSVVMNLHKRLTDTYQQEKEQLKEDMQRIEQEAKEEKEYLLKENKALMENDLVKRVKDKEEEIRGLKAKLETATNELNELRVESKQIVVEETYNQLRECEILLGTQKPITDILVIIRQKLSMLRKRPYTA